MFRLFLFIHFHHFQTQGRGEFLHRCGDVKLLVQAVFGAVDVGNLQVHYFPSDDILVFGIVKGTVGIGGVRQAILRETDHQPFYGFAGAGIHHGPADVNVLCRRHSVAGLEGEHNGGGGEGAEQEPQHLLFLGLEGLYDFHRGEVLAAIGETDCKDNLFTVRQCQKKNIFAEKK